MNAEKSLTKRIQEDPDGCRDLLRCVETVISMDKALAEAKREGQPFEIFYGGMHIKQETGLQILCAYFSLATDEEKPALIEMHEHFKHYFGRIMRCIYKV